MKKTGGYLAVAGILLTVLPYFGLTLRFLSWIDNWGETVSWAIKIGLIVVGAIMYFAGGNTTDTAQEE